MSNPFEQYPILVDLLELDPVTSSFYTAKTVVFLQSVIPACRTAAEHFYEGKSFAEKPLIAYFGKNWKCKLKPKKIGGDGDILDISDMLPEGPVIAPPASVPHVGKIKNKPVAKTKLASGHIYPEDRVSEFKEKLSLELPEVPIYKQHLWARSQELGVIPMYYRILSEGPVSIDIEHAMSEKAQVLGLPIDMSFYQNRESIQIEARDAFMTMGELYTKWCARRYYLVSLDTFTGGKEKQLEEYLRSDVYHLHLIYYAFIVKFFPMISSFEVFQTWVNGGPKALASAYPDLAPDATILRRRYDKEREILDYKYQLLEHPPADFLKYAPQLALENAAPMVENRIVDIAIKGATLVVKPRTGGQTLSSYVKLNVRNLFEEMRASSQIPLIKVSMWSPDGTLYLTKIKTPSLVDNDPTDIQRIYEKIKHRLVMPNNSTLLVAVPAGSAQSEDLFLILVLYENGKYQVKSAFGEEIQMDFKTMFTLMQEKVNPILEYVNSLGRGVFDSANRLPLISRVNSEFSGLYLSLFWKMPITAAIFEGLGALLKSDIQAGIIRPVEVMPGTYDMRMLKGITDYALSDLEQVTYIFNYYEYLSNAKVKARWQQLFGNGRNMLISYRTTDVRIEIQDLREKEFSYWYRYVISMLYRFEQSLKQHKQIGTNARTSQSNKTLKRTNILKVLKSKDPELYIFKRFGSNVVFSRLCQKNHQPLIYSPDEYQNLPANTREKTVKYWNFTTNTPMFYVCPNSKYPYLSFITNQHPRGYCLPCCKKTPATDEPGEVLSKRDHVYHTCIKQHTYTEEDIQESTSRYIMNYGKLIDMGRIGRLPDILDKYLLYNLEDREIIHEEQLPLTFKFEDREYSLMELIRITKHSKVRDVLLEQFRTIIDNYKLGRKTIPEILADPSHFPHEYNTISNADLTQPILILRQELGAFHLIEGIYRLAKAQLIGNLDISVKFITRSQLEKSALIPSGHREAAPVQNIRQINKMLDDINQIAEGVSGGNVQSMKKAAYYLYGVAQNSANIYNVGAGYAIAAALSITFYEFIEKLILFLKSASTSGARDYFRILHQGQLNLYFVDMEDLLLRLQQLFMEETQLLEPPVGGSKFVYWNELFIELADICFNKKVLILDDTSIDIAGTSIKASKVSENIDIILPIASHQAIESLIPQEDQSGLHEYILLLRRHKKSKSLFSSNHAYYPIFIFVPQNFFKNMHIEKRIYTHQDEIVKLLRKILEEALSAPQVSSATENIDLETLELFLHSVRPGWLNIRKYYLLSRNLCYAVELEVAGESATYNKIIWPVRYSTVSATNAKRVFGAYSRQGCVSFRVLKEVFESFNKWIVLQSEERGLYRVSPEKSAYNTQWNQREMALLPLWPFIKIERFLNLGQHIVGFLSRGLYYYCRPVALMPPLPYAKLLAHARNRYSMLSEGFMKLPAQYSSFYIRYDPDHVNKMLLRSEPQNSFSTIGFDPHKLSHAFYKRWQYNLFVIEIIHHLDQERHSAMRAKIRQIIHNTNFRQSSELTGFYAHLTKWLNSEDFLRIKALIEQNLMEQFDKKKVLELFSSEVYDFDRLTLAGWRAQLRDYDAASPDKRLRVRETLRREIMGLSNIFYISETASTVTSDTTFPNVLTACTPKSDTPYCVRGKMFLPKEDLPVMADLLAADLCHNLTRELLLSAIILGNIREHWGFTKHPGEEIYVKWEE